MRDNARAPAPDGARPQERPHQQVDRVLHERVIGRNEADIFAHNGPLALKRRQHPVAGNRGKAFDVGMARVEKDVAVFVFLDPHAEVVEQLDEEIA